jgi:hypothetical protein
MFLIMIKVFKFLLNYPNKCFVIEYPWLNSFDELPIFWFFDESMRQLPSFLLSKAPNHPQKTAQSIYFYSLRYRWLLSFRSYTKFYKFWMVGYWMRLIDFRQIWCIFFSLNHLFRYWQRLKWLLFLFIIKFFKHYWFFDSILELNLLIVRYIFQLKWLFFFILRLFHDSLAWILSNNLFFVWDWWLCTNILWVSNRRSCKHELIWKFFRLWF